MPVYEILDIGTLGGDEAQGLDINDRGEVTGEAATATGTSHAFVYRDGEMIDLGNLKADRYGAGASSGAAINNKGEVAGRAENEEGLRHAVLYTNESAIDLGTLGGAYSEGHAINEAGQVTGIAFTPGVSQYHAFLYSTASGLQDLGTLGDSYSTGDHINDAGDVAGIYQLQYDIHAYLHTQGSMVDLSPGLSSYISPSGVALNSAGHVVGTYRIDDTTRSFIYRGSGIADVGTLGGAIAAAVALNDSDQVTGDSTITDTGASHAFLWSTDGIMNDLGTLGGDFSNGTSINGSGQVTGQAATETDLYHPFVYLNGEMIDLGLPGEGVQGVGTAINALGQVTGIYQVRSGDRYQPFYSRGFIATPISLLFSKLQGKASAVGPGTILRATIRRAARYYDRSDAERTCSTLKAFELETSLLSYRRKWRDEMTKLAADARSLMTSVGCNTTEDNAKQLSKSAAETTTTTTTAAVAVRRALTSEEKEQALQWYREHFGIGTNGIFVNGRFEARPRTATQIQNEF